MPQRRPLVTQADIARAIRAMRAAGYDVRVVLTRDGAVVEPLPRKVDDARAPIDNASDDYLII